MFPLSLSPILVAYACLFSTATAADKSIFLLAGQSNMSGRGGVTNGTWDGVVPPQCSPNPSILRLNAALEWVEATEPLHADIDVTKVCGVGPGMPFASSLLEKDASVGVVGLVACAVGGTSISEWARGGQLYNRLLRRAEAAVNGSDGGGALQAMLWYQGEADTVSGKDAQLYEGRLKEFFVDLRADLLSPGLPIIQVALASGEGPFVERVREAQFQVAMDLPNVKTVDAKGLPLEPDKLHLSTPAEVQLGAMLSDAFLQTLPSPVPSHASKIAPTFFPNRY